MSFNSVVRETQQAQVWPFCNLHSGLPQNITYQLHGSSFSFLRHISALSDVSYILACSCSSQS